MAKTCTTEKTARRQRWIEQGLQELMLTRRFEEITVAELCRHLELSRRSFYRYFSDLEDVLDSLLHHAYQDLATVNTVLSVQELCGSFDFWLRRRDLLEALSRSGMSSKLMEYTLRYSEPDAIGHYLPPDDPAVDCRKETTLFAVGGLVSMIFAWHAEGFRKTPEQMAQIAYRLLTEPILKME